MYNIKITRSDNTALHYSEGRFRIRHHNTMCVYIYIYMETLESVQRETKRKGLEVKSYDEWLRELGMPSLFKKWIRGGMINTFQYLRGYQREEELFPKASESRTRSNGWKIVKVTSSLEVSIIF